MTDDDYDALSQKQLASIKRDMRISLEDAAVRATYKVMAELETEQNQSKGTSMTRPIGISVPHRRVEDDDDIQEYKRPWVGLTDEEQQQAYEQWQNDGWGVFYNAIEAKLKEKNT
jgi:hypothetical protein